MDSDDRLITATKKMKPGDFAEYDMLIGKIASRLNIVCHPDPSVTLKAIRMTLEALLGQSTATDDRCNKEFALTASAAKGLKSNEAKFTVNDITLPAVNKDAINDVDHASKVLKLLYLNDLKLLQTQVNQIIASVQSITATRLSLIG